MAGNVFGQRFQITTWGESHGRAVGVVVDGLPAGLPFSEADIQKELDRRRPGQSEVSTPRSEADRVEILSGLFEGMSTGTPVSMLVWNSDAKSSAYDAIKNTPRPGHADFTYMARYGMRDHRGGGRSSARETIGRVAGGALAKLLLSKFGIRIAGHVLELGGIRAKTLPFEEIVENVEKTPVRCADLEAAKKMLEKVADIRQEGDSVGGVVEVIAKGVPAGLGEPVFDRLDADLAKALMSIPAVKGFEIGAGFEAARLRGSEMNDPFRIEEGKITCSGNNAPGIIARTGYFSFLNSERIVHFTSTQAGSLKPGSDFKAFNCRNAHKGLCKVSIQPIKYRLSEARRHTFCNNFDNASNAISFLPNVCNFLKHFFGSLEIGTAHRGLLHIFYNFFKRKSLCPDSTEFKHMSGNPDSKSGKQEFCKSPACNPAYCFAG